MVEIVNFESRNKLINKDVVEVLEYYLDKAKKGEIVAVAIASVMDTGETYTTSARSDCYPALLGAIAQLQFRAHMTSNIIVEKVD